RAVGLVSVANRFVELYPGSSSASIPDGGVLDMTATQPLVDLDQLLDALDLKTRTNLQHIIKDGAKIFDGTAPDANRALRYLNPATAQARALVEELGSDTAAVERLVTTGASVASTFAARRDDLQSGITCAATTLRAIASQRAALGD